MGQADIFNFLKNNRRKYTTRELAMNLNMTSSKASILLGKTIRNFREIKRQTKLTNNSQNEYYYENV